MASRLLFGQFARAERLSQWLQQRFTSAGLFVVCGMLATGIFSIDTRRTLAFQVFAVLLVLLVIAWLGLRYSKLPTLTLQRYLPDNGNINQPCHYQLVIKNPHAQPLTDLWLHDTLLTILPDYDEFSRHPDPDAARRHWLDRRIGFPHWRALLRHKRGAETAPVAVSDIPAYSERTLNLTLQPLRRGYLRFEQITLLRPDPLGLMQRIRHYPLPDNLLILPQRYPVPIPALAGQRRYQPGGLQAATSHGDALEFKSLRDYRPGDPPRRIHWRSFAKTGHPIVKEYQEEYCARQALVLDTFLENRDPAQFEAAISTAASLLSQFDTFDSIIDMLFIGQQAFHFSAGRGEMTRQRLLEIVACAEPATSDRAFVQLHRHVQASSRLLSGCICLLLSTDANRLALINDLRRQGISTHALVLEETATGPVTAGVNYLRPSRLAQDLATLNLQADPAPRHLHRA
ncbi:MAG: DUF58 domain-containing protein [Gammaproteobacteria bacterium]